MKTAAVRVCLVGPLPPPSGGMAGQTEQLAELLRSEGLSVNVVQANAPYKPAWIGRVRGVRALFRLVPYCMNLWQANAAADVVHVMANSGWSWHLFAAPAVWIGWMRGRPVIVNYRGGGAAAFFARFFTAVRPTLSRAAAVAVPTEFLASVFRTHGVATTIVPNFVDLSRFGSSPGANGQKRRHLIVTRNLESIYDIGTAIRALGVLRADFPDAHLTIAGSGPEGDSLQRLATEIGVGEAVRFVGRIDNRQMPALYQSADLMLNPSTVDNTPNSILEAWAAGVPVVSTSVGGVPFLVRDGVDALLVPKGDPIAMAEAARRVMSSDELAQSLAASGRSAVQRFSWPAVRSDWLDLYARLAAAVPSSRPGTVAGV